MRTRTRTSPGGRIAKVVEVVADVVVDEGEVLVVVDAIVVEVGVAVVEVDVVVGVPPRRAVNPR
ncbi:MAG: hypothetical protein WD064_01095 [Acidimicrobiia bacterium]